MWTSEYHPGIELLMLKIIRMELRKAFSGKLFLSALLIALLLAVLCAAYNIEAMKIEKTNYQKALESGEGVNPDTQAYGLYNHWICEDGSSFLSSLFFMIFPILSAAAYGWSHSSERKSGYIKNVITRVGKKDYYRIKYFITFIAGGVVITGPVIVNFIITASALPAVTPDVFYDTFTGIFLPSMFSELFYSHPLIYSIIRMLIVFLYGGGVAVISFSLGFFVRNRVAVVILPFLLCLGLHYADAFMTVYLYDAELSPMYILGSHGTHFRVFWVTAAEFLLAVVPTYFLCTYKGKRDDVL